MDSPWQPSSPPVSASEIPALLAAEPLVVLRFWAARNGYDRTFEPIFRAEAAGLGRRVAFRSVDVDDPGLAGWEHAGLVANVPALAGFHRGRPIGTLVGMRQKDELREALRDWIGVAERREQLGDDHPRG